MIDTLPVIWHGLMRAPSITTPYCSVCGATGHVEWHHMVRRGAGALYRDGVELPKPTISLCGHGNLDGCHGLAHAGMLHFRWIACGSGYDWVRGTGGYTTALGGHLEYLVTDVPTKYQAALDMDGWAPLGERPEGHIFGANV